MRFPKGEDILSMSAILPHSHELFPPREGGPPKTKERWADLTDTDERDDWSVAVTPQSSMTGQMLSEEQRGCRNHTLALKWSSP